MEKDIENMIDAKLVKLAKMSKMIAEREM